MNIIQIYKQFPTQDTSLAHLESVRWKDGVICPYCQSKKITPAPKENRYHCNTCNTSFSVTVNTIFHKTKLDLQKWFLAITLVLNAKKGISSRQLSRDIEVNKNTAWYMLMRIRKAMLEQGDLMQGIVEIDETYIGGKEKNKHKNKKGGGKSGTQGRSTKTKTPVFGMLERDGKVRAKKVKDVQKRTLEAIIDENVQSGSSVVTDEWLAYAELKTKFQHFVIKHSNGEYTSGDAHTNTLEGFWSLFKRGILGQYHHLSEKHLDKYINEFCFRYNNRKNDGLFDSLLFNAVTIK